MLVMMVTSGPDFFWAPNPMRVMLQMSRQKVQFFRSGHHGTDYSAARLRARDYGWSSLRAAHSWSRYQ